MPVMFCYIDPFDMRQQVVKLSPDNTSLLFCGTIDEIVPGMALEYSTNSYDRIVLKGVLAESVAEQILEYGRTNYGLKDIEIEVLK